MWSPNDPQSQISVPLFALKNAMAMNMQNLPVQLLMTFVLENNLRPWKLA